MELLTQLLNALWAQDYETLANPSMIGMLYFVLFMILFLENGLLPAAFLPGDSLLVLVGVLIAKGAMGFPETLLLLTAAASLGCWLSYIQGRWLGNTRIVQNWLSHLPSHYHQRAHHLFHKHGLSALLIGRFIAFVRTLLPTIAGLSGLNNARFQFFNWMSGLLWVLILTSLGYLLGKTPVFLKYEDQLMSCLMLLPVALLVFGLIGSLVVLWKKKYRSRGCASSAGCWVVLFCSAPCSGFGWRCSSRRPRWRSARLARVSECRTVSPSGIISMPTASALKASRRRRMVC